MSLVSSSLIEKNWRNAIRELDCGELEFVAPGGEVTRAKGAQPGPGARFQIDDWDVLRRIMARGDIGLGEEYIAGSWETDNVEAAGRACSCSTWTISRISPTAISSTGWAL